MIKQKRTFPNLNLDVPIIVPTLIRAMREAGATKCRGIFRISPAKDQLVELRKQVEAGNFDVKVDDPHLPAALLKEWLRELSEPLISYSMYDRCIAIVQTCDTPTVSGSGFAFGSVLELEPSRISPTHVVEPGAGEGARGSISHRSSTSVSPSLSSTDDPADIESHVHQEVTKIVDELPVVNRTVLHMICDLLNEIGDEANCAINSMPISNLAIIFGPSLLRSASASSKNRKQDLAAQIKLQTRFVSLLLRVLSPVRLYPPLSEHSN